MLFREIELRLEAKKGASDEKLIPKVRTLNKVGGNFRTERNETLTLAFTY